MDAWTLRWDFGSATVQSLGGMLGGLELRLPDGRRIRPLAEGDWSAADGPEYAALPPMIRELRGEWPCVPFGKDEPRELPAVIGGERRMPGGESFTVVAPHDHHRVLGTSAHGDQADARAAIDAALAAAPAWRGLSFDDRAAVLLRAADLLSGPWRARMNAAAMLGQAKTVYQAEIDAACELADFFRFNVHFARGILADQPVAHSRGIWNRVDHRPLEGFVYAITPFNFTSIAGNLPTAPALMGNVVVWKPSPTQQLSASVTMDLLEAAGLPAGVINMLPGAGPDISEIALADADLAGIHFTGSTATFQKLWAAVGANIASYRSYPRLVGETGGKDFVVAHASADIDTLRVAMVRGAFEYSGQKCSAASRAYVPASLWPRLKDALIAETEALAVGDVEDFGNFTSAVIDDRAFAKLKGAIDRARATDGIEVLERIKADERLRRLKPCAVAHVVREDVQDFKPARLTLQGGPEVGHRVDLQPAEPLLTLGQQRAQLGDASPDGVHVTTAGVATDVWQALQRGQRSTTEVD